MEHKIEKKKLLAIFVIVLWAISGVMVFHIIWPDKSEPNENEIVISTVMTDTPATENEITEKIDAFMAYSPLETVETEIMEPVVEVEPEVVEPIMDIETDPYEVELLATVIYQEAGGDSCSDDARRMVADVVLNRVASPYFPDTIEKVLTAKAQYGNFSKTGVVWPARASLPEEAVAVQRAYYIANDVLSGNHTDIYGKDYVWQAEFKQGIDIIELDGIYFGKMEEIR